MVRSATVKADQPSRSFLQHFEPIGSQTSETPEITSFFPDLNILEFPCVSWCTRKLNGHMLSLALAGPLALVEDGDIIAIDVLSQSIDVRVPHEELKKRSESWTPPSLPLTQVRPDNLPPTSFFVCMCAPWLAGQC